MTRLIATGAAVVVAVALVITGYFALWGRTGGDSSACRTTAVAGQADIGGPFELINGQSQTVTDKDVITEPSLVYFGYTYCPDVCPLDVDRNAGAVEVLEERGISVTPVFISIDPERDTPDVVADFAENMHPKMIGLTGSSEQVAAASAAYRTYYKAHKDEGDDYLVDHSTFTYLVTPQDGFQEFFRRELTPEQMADRVACFLKE